MIIQCPACEGTASATEWNNTTAEHYELVETIEEGIDGNSFFVCPHCDGDWYGYQLIKLEDE